MGQLELMERRNGVGLKSQVLIVGWFKIVKLKKKKQNESKPFQFL